MTKFRYIAMLATLAFMMNGGVAEAQGKGKGQGGGQSEEKGKGKGKGNQGGESKGRGQETRRDDDRTVTRGNAKGSPAREVSRGRGPETRGRFAREANPGAMKQSVRRYATSGRARDAIVAAALTHAFARGRSDNDFRISSVDDGVRIVNLRGDPLVYLDEQRARDLGRWRVGVLDDRVNEGSPAFCRSGEGHPVWGRQWCLEKGFGLGGYEDFRWGRSLDPVNITYHQPSLRDQLMGAALERVLGTNTYNRLALHAVTLGLVDPLAGTWYTEPTGSQLLRVNSGVYPVAEIVDTNRDYTGDLLLLALRSFL